MFLYGFILDSFKWDFEGKMIFTFNNEFCDEIRTDSDTHYFNIIFDCKYSLEGDGDYLNESELDIKEAWIEVNDKRKKLNLEDYVLKEIFKSFAIFEGAPADARDLKSELEYLTEEIFEEKRDLFEPIKNAVNELSRNNTKSS